jgi:hypothetical protein
MRSSKKYEFEKTIDILNVTADGAFRVETAEIAVFH